MICNLTLELTNLNTKHDLRIRYMNTHQQKVAYEYVHMQHKHATNGTSCTIYHQLKENGTRSKNLS